MAKFRYIYIEITNSCNFSCPFCPSSSLNQSEFMKLDDFKVVIDKIKKYLQQSRRLLRYGTPNQQRGQA